MQTQYVTCPNCHSQNLNPGGRCSNCGTLLPISPMPMQPVYQTKPPGADKKIAAGLCGILLGGLGIHKFILGYNTEGVIMLVGSLLTCGVIPGVIGLVEGIIYLTKSDEEFVQTYIIGKKPWF